MALKEFSGELMQEPQLKAFTGELEGAEPSLKDRIYKAANSLFGRGSVMDNYDSEQTPMALPLVDPQTVSRVITQNAYAKAPSVSASDTRMVSGLPGVLEVGARKGYAGIGRIEAGAIKALADLAGSDTLTDIVDNQSRYADQVENAAILRQAPVAGFGPESIAHEVPQAASNVIGSVLQTAPSMAAGALAPGLAIPAIVGTTGLQEYGEGRQSGLGGGGAALRAIPMAFFEGAGEKLGGFDKIARGLNAATRGNGAAQLGGAMLSSAAREVPGEEFTTAGQFLTDKLPGVGLNQEATMADYIKAAKDTALATVLQSGGMAAGGKVLQGAANRVMPTPATQAVPENVQIIGNPAPQPVNPQAATNLAKTIADTATMDSKLKPAPADVELIETPQAQVTPQQDQPIDPNVSATPEAVPEGALDGAKILQNRNRATPSSIAQMTSIAANPDYGRLSFSRDFANGAPVVAGGTIPANQLGTTDVAVASDGRRIPVQYAVVDASELLPSNRADGLPNEAYDDPTADLTRAIAGNGRVAGLQEAYNKSTAGEYRKELLADRLHGVDPAVIENMTRPVLVRVMPNEFVTADIGDVSNTVGNLELSPVEQANNDVQRVNLEALSFADDGSVTAQAVRQFVQAMPQAEQGSLLDTNGQPTKQAVDRLNAAIFAKAYGNDQLIRLYAQAQNGEARNVLSALAQVAPKMARLAGAGHLDIRQVVTDAAEIVVNAVRKGLTITRAAQQVDMTADPDVVEVLQLYAANVRSSRAVAEALGRAADFAYSEAVKPAEDMFGEVPKASRQEVLAQLRTPDEQGITQDIQDAQGIGGIPQDSQRAAVQPGRPGNADGAGTGGPVDDTTVRQDAPEYGLDSYTNRDIVERLDRIEKAQKEAAERARAEEAKRQADLERETFGLTGSESQTDRLEAQGQGRLFQAASAYNDPDYVEQRDLFLDYGPVESQDTQGGETAKRQASTALDDLHASGSVLGKALSRDYAANQRVSLVGQRIDSPADLATLAQVYRDPRFETFRLIFVNDAGRIVSQLGLTSRLPTSAQAIVGNDSDAYLSEVSKIAKQRGATRFWMLHNHPSGKARPSSADLGLTRLFTEKMPGLTNNGHVIIDTNEYGFIDPFATGEFDVRFKDFGAVEPMTAGEFTGFKITDAESVMELAKRIEVDADAVTLVAVDAQLRVQRITTVPVALVTESNAINRRTLLKETLSGNGYFIFAVGRNMQAVERLGRFSIDGVHVDDDGALTTLTSIGRGGEFDLFPNQRRPRVTPDTGNEFDYLRRVPTAQAMAAVREDEADFGPVLTQYRGNAQGAIQKLLELRTGDAEAALSHPDIGDIDLIYGKEGDPKYDYRDGFGLGKIASKHPEVLGDLQSIIASMRVTMRSENRVNLESDTHKGAVRLEWNGQRKTWLLTTFEKVADGASTRTDTTGLSGEGDTARSAAAAPIIVEDNGNNATVRETPFDYDNPQESMNLPAPGPRFDPIRTRDWFSVERAANGQRQYAAGRKLWDRASGYAAQYLGKIKLVDTKPGTFKELLRQFNVDKTKASQQAKRFAESGKELSQEQRTLLSDLIEKQVAVGDTTPQEIIDLAATITTALDVQARELVDLGMLSEDRLVKNYLPRIYKSGLAGALTNPAIIRSWFTKARMRIRGDRLKSRGMFAEIAVNQVEQAKKLGWKVSAMTDGTEAPADLLRGLETGDVPAKYQDSKVLMWRDYTQSEREQMGEIRDGVLRYALGYVETQKDIAIGRLFKAIASNPELAKDHNPGGWVKVPDQEIAGAPGAKAYGALSGMWVEPQVADSLKRNTQPKGVLMAAYDKALSFWKEGKTVWNPVAHGNNVVSNLFTIHFAGINPADPRRWRETLREYRTKGQYYNEALDNGLFGNEWANQEIQDLLMPDFASMSDMEDVAASRVAKVVELAKKAGKPVSFYREKMQKAYEFEDQFFKLMLYIDRRKAGMDPQAAITDAERYVFNYADMPEGVEVIKRTVSPFFAYTYKAIPMVLHTAMTRPDRMLAPIALLGGANWLAYMMLGADEDEERKAMPEYMKGRTFIGTQKAVRLPFNIDDRPAFLDMSRRVPLGDLFDINNQTNGLPLPAPFMPSHPVLSMMQAVIYNQDTFTGRDLVKKSDTGWEAAQARAGYVARQFMPNAPFVPGSYNFNKLADATAYMFDTEIGPYTGYSKSGDPIRMGTVLPDVLTGTKIRTFDVDRGMAYQNADLSKEAKEIQANIRSAQRNKAMTESAREKFIEGQQEKLRRLGERRTDLNQ